MTAAGPDQEDLTVPDGLPAQIANTWQAALLLDVELRPLLTLLMAQPQTVSGVAGALGTDLNRAHYRIMKLLRAGIAVVDSVQPRAGRAICSYRVPPNWFIPFDVTSDETLEVFGSGQVIPRMHRLVRNAVQIFQEQTTGRRGYWLSANSLHMGDEAGPADSLFLGDEPFLLNIGQIHLSRENASELKRRLLNVIQEFEAHERPAETSYAVGLMIVRGAVG